MVGPNEQFGNTRERSASRLVRRPVTVFVAFALVLLVVAAFVAHMTGAPQPTLATHLMPCADIDGDRGVTQIDANIEASYFGMSAAAFPAADVYAGGAAINLDDILAVASAAGTYTLCQDTPLTWSSGTPPAPGSGTTDLDGDGCPDVSEGGLSATSGGLRDYLNPWDYFNPEGDGTNRVSDILLVFSKLGIDQGDPGYTLQTDRSWLGPNNWNLGPPDGLQRMDDVLEIVKQFFHDC